ncbi:MAG: cobalamin-dependent protein, partial [Syntrophobacterales bacterium]
MKVLLVYPEYPVTFWSFDHALKFISKKAAYPPLGLLTVAALLPDDWDIRLVDLNIEKLKDKDLVWADYVMISAMLIQKKSVLSIIQRCHQLGTKVIAGGPLFNSAPEEYFDLVDHLILNEAELTLPPFLEDLKNGTPKKVYRTEAFP